MNDLSKSLITVNNAYYFSKDKIYKIDYDKSFPDLSNSYLSHSEQVKEYKRLIIQSKDIDSVFFFLNGLKNLDQISIDFDILKNISIEIIKQELRETTHRELAERIGISTTIIRRANADSFITDESAIKVIFTFNKNILKELIK